MASAGLDNRVRETQAGKTFLDILQRSHETESNVSNSTFDVHTKRNSLRIALEHLIIEYLRELAPDEEIYDARRRRRRSLNDMPKNDNSEVLLNENGLQFGSANINFFRESDTINTACKNKYTRISKLDQSEFDNAVANNSDNVHNIRRMLMYRLVLVIDLVLLCSRSRPS